VKRTNSATEQSVTRPHLTISRMPATIAAITSRMRHPDARESSRLYARMIGALGSQGKHEVIQPTEDRVLIQRIDEPSDILLTDQPKSIKGLVLAVGPGKWHPGEWWSVPKRWVEFGGMYAHHGNIVWERKWRWIPGYREPVTVQPGQIVAFNSRWNDLSHAENKGTGADGKGPLERPLSYNLAKNQHLVREADIFGILPNERIRVEYLRTGMEELFVNRSIA